MAARVEQVAPAAGPLGEQRNIIRRAIRSRQRRDRRVVDRVLQRHRRTTVAVVERDVAELQVVAEVVTRRPGGRRVQQGLRVDGVVRPLCIRTGERTVRDQRRQRRRTRVATHDRVVAVAAHPLRDHAVVLVGVVEQRDADVVRDLRRGEREQRRLRAVGVPQRQVGVVVMTGIDRVHRAVEAEVATVDVVVRRRHQERVVEPGVEGLLLRRGAAGHVDAVQPRVPRRLRTRLHRVERRAVRSLGVEVVGGAGRVGVAQTDP